MVRKSACRSLGHKRHPQRIDQAVTDQGCGVSGAAQAVLYRCPDPARILVRWTRTVVWPLDSRSLHTRGDFSRRAESRGQRRRLGDRALHLVGAGGTPSVARFAAEWHLEVRWRAWVDLGMRLKVKLHRIVSARSPAIRAWDASQIQWGRRAVGANESCLRRAV